MLSWHDEAIFRLCNGVDPWATPAACPEAWRPDVVFLNAKEIEMIGDSAEFWAMEPGWAGQMGVEGGIGTSPSWILFHVSATVLCRGLLSQRCANDKTGSCLRQGRRSFSRATLGCSRRRWASKASLSTRSSSRSRCEPSNSHVCILTPRLVQTTAEANLLLTAVDNVSVASLRVS